MKIVYIVEDFAENGGVERIVSLKANELSTKYGHDVTIVSVYKDERPVLYSLDKSIGFVRLDVPFATKSHGRIATLASRLATLARAASRLNKTVKQLNPDIIFFTTTLGALLLPFCRTKAKRVYESHLARPFNPYQQLFWLTKRSADAVICLTKGDMHAFGDGKNVQLIPNFIEQPKRSVADYGRKKAIAVGRLENQKGFDMLIDCWKRVSEQHPDGTYTIAVTLEGGSGKASIQSPCTLTVADGKMTATIVWSSSHYDYMLVDGERCDVLSTENGSTFEIPVAALDTPLAVVGDPTAMSTPHEIDYTLTFDASSAEVNR